MKKEDAISIFGERKDLAAALEITPQAISQWPERLSQEQADRVRGAAIRLGKPIPRRIRGVTT